MEWWWMDSPNFSPRILEFQGRKFLRASPSEMWDARLPITLRVSLFLLPCLISRNKLPFMILNPRSEVQKNAFPAEKCTFPQKNALSYSDPTEIPPPYRETGVAIPLSHCVFCGITDYRCYTPLLFHANALSQPKDRLWRGVSQKKLVSEAYRAIVKGAQTMKCKLWTETLEFWR